MPRNRASSRVAASMLLAGSLLTACAPSAPPDTAPRLVVLLAIDQLRPDRLHADLPGGLGRLVREGRSFREAALEHAYTETCAGHVTMLTGRNPAATGIPGNAFIDSETFTRHYCVEDPTETGQLVGPDGPQGELGTRGRSPRNMTATTLGDWMKEAWSDSRVIAVSGKDRAAITLGGQRPDGAFWIDTKGSGDFVSSLYYGEALPDWAARWRFARMRELAPALWTHPTGAPDNGARYDDYPAESPIKSRTSPHPVMTVAEALEGDEALGRRVAQLGASPWLDEATLGLARDALRGEQLGQRKYPDLLAISLSATDYIGHHYGPESQEALDALGHLDRQLERFFAFLDEEVGAGRWLVVLTADHGVLALPEWLQETGRSRCPVPGGRVEEGDLDSSLDSSLLAVLGDDGSQAGRWVARLKARITVNRERVALAGTTVEEVVEVARRHLERDPVVAKVWTPGGVAGAAYDTDAGRFARSMVPGRGGDLAIQIQPDCLLTSYPTGTSHGSVYAYDRAVPLIFLGGGVEASQLAGRAAPIDIAPTLAALLGLASPSDLDGRVLPLGDR